MPYALDILSGAQHAAVTNARATDDYFHEGAGDPPQWAIGAASILYWALGILPFKDGFYSSTHAQVGGQTVGPELRPQREILMATLSTAMVGPMDGIGLLNKTRVMSSCRADGVILKPDQPLTTVDECFRAAPGQTPEPAWCFIFHTFSDVPLTASSIHGAASVGAIDAYRAHYWFSDEPRPLQPRMIYLPPEAAAEGHYVVYDWHSGRVQRLQPAGTSLDPSYEGFVYGVVVPSFRGMALLGEVDKLVPLSSLRFKHVALTTSSKPAGLEVTIRGVANETVRVCAAAEEARDAAFTSWVTHCTAASFGTPGEQTIVFTAAGADLVH